MRQGKITYINEWNEYTNNVTREQNDINKAVYDQQGSVILNRKENQTPKKMNKNQPHETKTSCVTSDF